jgi:hypothetical protein
MGEDGGPRTPGEAIELHMRFSSQFCLYALSTRPEKARLFVLGVCTWRRMDVVARIRAVRGSRRGEPTKFRLFISFVSL